MNVWKSIMIGACLVPMLELSAQEELDLPRTNIVMADMWYQNGNFTFNNLKQVSVEEDCYENQPRFTIDGRYVLYSREYRIKKGRKMPDVVTTDICSYRLNNGRTERLTESEEYEFSPQESEFWDQITAVQLNDEGEQYIVKYNEEGEFERDEELNGERVGYYSWLNRENVLIYALPEPATLKWINIYTGEEHLITSKIGRTIEFFKRDNGIYYVDKSNEESWSIKRLYLDNMEAEPETVIEMKPGVEDFAMLNDGSFISCYNGKLFHFAPGKMGEFNGKQMENWRLIADLDRLDMPSKVTRLAVSPQNNAIVMVVDEADEWFDTKKKKKK